MAETDIDALARQEWDVVVVGTGIGGATIGHGLARKGRKVLFCERGFARQAGLAEGDYAERLCSPITRPTSTMDAKTLHRAGRWPTPVVDMTGKGGRNYIPFMGSGVGGSSALYGMVMERFTERDFQPDREMASGLDIGESKAWPISMAELQPYYRQAEALYRVRGSADPLRRDWPDLLAPPPLSAAAAALSQRLAKHAMHPYQLPSACEYVPGCMTCQGYLCPRQCKNDAWQVAIQPAITQYGAVLIDECEVIRLQSSGRVVTSLECVRQGKPLLLRAGMVILAAGALATPALLLRSASADCSNGLANRSGRVGRNLMRHLIDMYIVKAEAREGYDNRRKEIAFNDFYHHGPDKLGTVQSFGRLPPAEMIVNSIGDDIAGGDLRWALPLLKLVSPVLRLFLRRMVDESISLASIVEDYPRPDNRVELSGGDRQTLVVHYRNDDDALRRIALMRRLMKECLRSSSYRMIADATNNQRLAHVCGTCRMGDDSRSSVVDKNCRAHDLENLYVVDSSCFVSSGGTNPSLTIAANALRVAAHLAGEMALPTAGVLPARVNLS